MVDQNQEMCLIFEDDAIVPPDFIEKTNQLIQESNLLKDSKNWDVWLLGGKWDDLSSIPNETSKTGIVRVGSFILFHAYIITLNCAKKLLKDVQALRNLHFRSLSKVSQKGSGIVDGFKKFGAKAKDVIQSIARGVSKKAC